MNYKPVIGLEVHVELKTKSKMFCGCKAEYFGEKPNSNTCPVCLGLPGALPVPNKKAIEWCVMIGLALNCKVPLFSKFDRKNYFYPDLPKGYQISQYDQPFCINGYITIKSEIRNTRFETNSKFKISREAGSRSERKNSKKIRIRRVHMEEDTAKLVHQFGTRNSKLKTQNGEGYSLIDFNRSGVPLVEIVTEPDFETAKEVVGYLKKLQQIVRYLDVSDADMEKGEMRLEPNISLAFCHPELVSGSNSSNEMPKPASHRGEQVRHDNNELPNYKVEVKNINSFRFVEKAIEYEIRRQSEILNQGKTPTQETRGWEEDKQKTVSQRVKEEANDYRYFPEPDIPPTRWTESQISSFKSQMPELPDAILNRFTKQYELSVYDAEILTRERGICDFFEKCVKTGKRHGINAKQIANVIINRKIDINTVLPAQLIQNILTSIQTTAINDKALEKIVKVILERNKKAVEDYKKGKTAVIGFLIGQIKQAIKQPLDTQQLKKAIEKLTKTH